MIDGVTITNAIRFVDVLNKDISRLIGATDDEMEAMEYTSLWGGPCYFKSSASVFKPNAWVPHVLARVYVQENKKENQAYSTLTFLSIYLTPKHHEEPLAHWGVGRRKPGKDIWPVWDGYLLRPEGPEFLRTREIEPFETTNEFSEIFETFRHAVKPLIELHSEEQLERFVLGPIRKELDSIPDSPTEPPNRK